MHEADQLITVEEHAGSPGLAAENILDMLLESVILVTERYELVPAWVRKDAQGAGQVTRNPECPFLSLAFDKNPHYCGIKRFGDFAFSSLRQFGPVDEERRTVGAGDGSCDTFSPRMLSGLKEDLEKPNLSLAQLGQGTDDADKWIEFADWRRT